MRMLEITFGIEEEEDRPKTLLEELSELIGPPSSEEEIEEQEPFTLASIPSLHESPKKKKKDKKKKKKEKDHGFMPLGPEPIKTTLRNGEVVEVEYEGAGFIDFDSVDEDEDEDAMFVDRIVDPNRKAYQKLKKDKNKYKREVAEELTLLYDLLQEIDRFSKRLTKRYEEVDNSKTRGLSKFTVDLANSVIASKKSKMDVIKEISNIKKTVAELKMKHDEKIAKLEREAAKDGGNQSNDMLASSYLQGIINYGRKNFLDDVDRVTGQYVEDPHRATYEDSSYERDDDEDEEEDEEDFEDFQKDMMDTNDFDEMIEMRLRGNNNGFRSEEGQKYLDYSQREVKIKIQRDEANDTYWFFAEDKDGEIIDDYPLPSEDRELNPIRFSMDGKYGTDRRGRTYKVINM